MLKVGIVGAGLIGGKRAAALPAGEAKLIAVADVNRERAEKLAQSYGAEAQTSWEALVRRPDIDAIVIATSNDVIPQVSVAALEAGKHVLVEKPGGRHPEDVRKQVEAAERSGRVLRVGFNHRFHPGLLKAKELVASGEFGPLMFIRARYGHGGRLGYEKEWRGKPEISGGGELLDQGVHLVDLCRWIGGEFDLSWGHAQNFFWDWVVEDNGFLFLQSPDQKRAAFLHASCSEWKNLFDFEIYCRTGKIQVFGLGRSYGVEELRIFKMKPEMGPPETTIEKFEGEDRSWNLEWQAFADEIAGKRGTPIATIDDALKSVEIVHGAYKASGWPFARS